MTGVHNNSEPVRKVTDLSELGKVIVSDEEVFEFASSRSTSSKGTIVPHLPTYCYGMLSLYNSSQAQARVLWSHRRTFWKLRPFAHLC